MGFYEANLSHIDTICLAVAVAAVSATYDNQTGLSSPSQYMKLHRFPPHCSVRDCVGLSTYLLGNTSLVSLVNHLTDTESVKCVKKLPMARKKHLTVLTQNPHALNFTFRCFAVEFDSSMLYCFCSLPTRRHLAHMILDPLAHLHF